MVTFTAEQIQEFIDANRDAIVEVLRNNLRLDVGSGGFTCPNDRKVTVSFVNPDRRWDLTSAVEIMSDTFDVVQKREYEG